MRRLIISGIAVLAGVFAYGQPAPKMEFEVASVKATEVLKGTQAVYSGAPKGGPGTDDPEHIVWPSVMLRTVLLNALDMKVYQLTGPTSLNDEFDRYDFAVKIPAGATKDQVKQMWLNLLAERFGMKLHHESKEFQVDELVVGKDGPKLKASTVEIPASPIAGPPNLVNGELRSVGFITFFRQGPGGVTAKIMAVGQTLDLLVLNLSNQLKRPVIDKTGVTGRYDYSIDYVPDTAALPPPPPGANQATPIPSVAASDPGQTLVAAIQQQLGLRLTKGKATLDTVVVDKLEKTPTAN